MVEKDTVRLLRECDAGVKMGVDSLREVIPYTSKGKLRELLATSVYEHETLGADICDLLKRYDDGGKDPNPIAKGMARMKTNMKLVMNESDNTVASIITDGCNMGIKSLSRYLNEYAAADEKSKSITKRLISIEERLSDGLRDYL